MPQLVAELDGLGIHFVHQRGTGPAPYPLVITQGWPGSGFDMGKITPLLADPGGHGADPADAFDVVVPSPPLPSRIRILAAAGSPGSRSGIRGRTVGGVDDGPRLRTLRRRPLTR
ncbi:epoxide hydrolase N-terminal domain-containing protein [Streptomyces aurantiacus]|uniref:Epoxide hydrolase N-terminal domain-containing protein n=1 Tax=Streptomyces aurantiacus TaxID=47760 RepID=A0A7G1PGZ7_9ACTN|nr:hypothetical protein GCM10017557_81160 [Streptomyces aurantiacus]